MIIFWGKHYFHLRGILSPAISSTFVLYKLVLLDFSSILKSVLANYIYIYLVFSIFAHIFSVNDCTIMEEFMIFFTVKEIEMTFYFYFVF